MFPGNNPDAPTVATEVSTSLAIALGPVLATVDRLGFQCKLGFPESGGNLGFADLALGLKTPTGVGLKIDAPMVSGGGFLDFDPSRGQYAGAVHLDIQGKLALNALGLIATRLPDNTKGFSLLVIITAQDFKPIPLGLGFSLAGVGGLLAINRTFAEDVLRAGLKNHTLDSVMFPQDVIRNAPQILGTLQHVFPIARGHHLFGPMARITWGTPPLLTADLGLVLEFGKRLRLLILGQITAILPRRDHDLIRLQMDAMGVIDFDQGTAALDAALYDSRLLKRFVLTGDMAMRLRWEGSPSFALAVGGLHPAFNPPPNFPKLERIALNLAAGDNPRLRCEAYFALTARAQAALRRDSETEPQGDPLAPIMDAPEFPQPMYEALRDLSQEFLFPGLEHVPPNTIALLTTNAAFVEAFLVGLNTEMSRELLWRNYPTDQRGTYFRHFWDTSSSSAPHDDIPPIHLWSNTSHLGTNAHTGDQLVLLLRGELIRRYPNAVIYAAQAVLEDGQLKPSKASDHGLQPLFRGTLKPDVTFLGFPLSKQQALAGLGYFFIIQQQPTEPRFGLDEANFTTPQPPPLTTWNDLSWRHLANTPAALQALSHATLTAVLPEIPDKAQWKKNAAHQAYITLQRPVRIAIHARDMLTKGQR